MCSGMATWLTLFTRSSATYSMLHRVSFSNRPSLLGEQQRTQCRENKYRGAFSASFFSPCPMPLGFVLSFVKNGEPGEK